MDLTYYVNLATDLTESVATNNKGYSLDTKSVLEELIGNKGYELEDIQKVITARFLQCSDDGRWSVEVKCNFDNFLESDKDIANECYGISKCMFESPHIGLMNLMGKEAMNEYESENLISERAYLLENLTNKANEECENFISQLEKESPKTIINNAYQIITYEQMLDLLNSELFSAYQCKRNKSFTREYKENEYMLSLKAIKALNRLNCPLESCYDEWISSSVDENELQEQLKGCIKYNGEQLAKSYEQQTQKKQTKDLGEEL